MSKQTQFLDTVGLHELWNKMCATFPKRDGSGASGLWEISITGNAGSAGMLTSNAGSATKPIYFDDGKPVACNDHLDVDVDTVEGLSKRYIVHGVARHTGTMNLNTLDSTVSVFTEIRPIEITTTNLPSGWGEQAYGALLSLRDGNSNYGHAKLQLIAKSGGHMWFRCQQSANEAITSSWRLLLDSSNYSSYAAKHDHTHSFSGTYTTGAPSNSTVSVAKGAHTHQTAEVGHEHSYTPEGTVTVTLSNPTISSTAPVVANGSTTSVTLGTHTHTVSDSGTHSHEYTPVGTVGVTLKNNAVTSDKPSADKTSVATGGHTHTASATAAAKRVNIPNTAHTHSVTISGTSDTPSNNTTSVATGGHTHSTGGPTSGGTVLVPDTAHTHNVTSNVTVSDKSFTGTAGTTDNCDAHYHTVTPKGNVTVEVGNPKVTSDKPSNNTTSVATGGHTHKVTTDVRVNTATFAGNAVDAHTHTINATADTSKVDVAKSDHGHGSTSAAGGHTPTGAVNIIDTWVGGRLTISLEFVGNAIGNHTHDVAEAPTTTATVALGDHTHSAVNAGNHTPSGTVTVTLNNPEVEVGATAAANKVSIPNTNHTHGVTTGVTVTPTLTLDIVESSNEGSHNHTYTPEGTIAVTLVNNNVTSTTPSNNTASVATGSHIHSVDASANTVNVPNTSHTHGFSKTTSTAAADTTNITSVALGDHTHSVSATGDSNKVDVPNTNHTHGVTSNVTVDSATFTGTEKSTADAGVHNHTTNETVADSKVDIPDRDHVHNVTTEVAVTKSTFSGTAATISGGKHKHDVNATADNTTHRVNVPTTEHTHGVTISGDTSQPK